MRPGIGKKIIYGCEGRGDADSPYLTRYTLLSTPIIQVCLHIFHRSDADDLHDHPWPFASLILWRGYVEVVQTFAALSGVDGTLYEERARSRKYPGMLLFRSARHTHRVELINGKPAVTLVVMGPRQRTWGFWTKRGWQRWKQYFEELGC